MARRYVTVGEQNAPGTASILTLYQGSGQYSPSSIYDLVIGASGTPADQAAWIEALRFSGGGGVGTAVSCRPLDPADVTASIFATSDLTTEPTYDSDSVLLVFGINQQATFRWYVPPEEGLVISTVFNAGIGLRIKTASGGAALYNASVFHEE